MLFAIDTSREITQETFDKMRKFVKGQLALYNLSSLGTRISLLGYGDRAEPILFLRNGVTQAAVTTALNDMKRTGGERRLDLALTTARNDMLSKRGGAKDSAGKLLVVLITGANDPAGVAELGREGKALADAGIKVSVTGIGPNVKDKELNDVASDPSVVSKVVSFDGLKETTPVLSVAAGRAAGNCSCIYKLLLPLRTNRRLH